MTEANTEPQSNPSRYLTVVFGLFLLCLLGIPLTVTGWADDMGDKWLLIRVLGPLLLTLLLFYLSGREISRRPLPLLPVFAFALLGTQLFSLTDTTNLGISLSVITRQLALISFFLMARYFSRRAQWQSGILDVLILVGTATALYGIAQHFGYDYIDWQKHREVPTRRGTSFMGHASFAASALIILLPLATARCVGAPSHQSKAVYATAVVLMLYHLSFTGARVATLSLFLAAGVALALLYYSLRHSRDNQTLARIRSNRIALPAVAIVFAVVTVLFVGRAWQEKGSDPLGLQEGGMAQRIFAWETANRMFLANPVNGVGVGNYQVASPPYWNRIESIRYSRYLRALYQPHNEYLETAAESGLPGIAILLGLLVVAFTRGVSGLQRSPVLYCGLLTAFIATVLDAAFMFPWQVPDSSLFFWLLLGLIDGAQPDPEAALN